MKKILTYSILIAVTLLSACRKSDNPKIPTLARVPIPSLSKDPTGTGTIIVSDLANFVGKVNVDLFQKSDVPPKKMDLVIIKNGDKTILKVLKADITTFPSVISFTGSQLTTLFGSVQTCDFYDVGVNITTQDGVVYEAFPAIGSTYGAGVANQYGGVNTKLTYATKVEYDPAVYNGNFVVVSDAFGEYAPGDVVVLTKVSATQFTFLYTDMKNPLPININVDPATLKVSVAKQKIGDSFLSTPQYTNPNVATINTTANNVVIPCSQTVNLTFNFTVDQGSFGENLLVLKKQ